MTFQVGEVRNPTSEDFEAFIKLCDDDENWNQYYNKNGTSVFVKQTSYTDFQMFKVKSTVQTTALIMYNVLHDNEYRGEWDKNIIDGFHICRLGPNSDIGYYSMKSPLAFKNRDFVTQRCWRMQETDYIIFNHSVFHKAAPPKKNFIRGISYVTGYLIRPINESMASLTYITQANPRGLIPAWAMNSAAKYVVPKIIQRFQKSSEHYPSWKEKHQPEFMPWNNFDQCVTPIINMDDILQNPDIDININIDEKNVKESAPSEMEDFDID